MQPLPAKGLALLVPASKKDGLGHFFRTYPIWEAFPAAFYLSQDEMILDLAPGRAKALPKVLEGRALVDSLQTLGLGLLWVDHYGLSEVSLRSLVEQKEFPVLFFDRDFSNPAFPVLLNNNPFAATTSYRQLHPGTEYFLGPDYYLFRSEITQWKGRAKKSRIFVCMGGSDALNLTLRILPILPISEEYCLVLGPAAGTAYAEEVNALAQALGLKHELWKHPKNFFELMSACDRAILSCSTVVYEALFLGLSVLCYQVVDNQDNLAEWLRAQGVFVQDARLQEPRLSEFRSVSLEFGRGRERLFRYLREFQ